jgi:integrase
LRSYCHCLGRAERYNPCIHADTDDDGCRRVSTGDAECRVKRGSSDHASRRLRYGSVTEAHRPGRKASIYGVLPGHRRATGLRWGELTELRVHDVNWQTGVLTISRVAVEIPARFHPDGQRFVVKPYPKDKEWRRLGLSQHIFQQLVKHAKRFAGGDLLFCVSQPTEQRLRPRHAAPQSADVGLTEPNPTGRQYRHGTLSGYSAGRCRCQHCKDAYASYRARRRADGRDSPRAPRKLTTDGHIPRVWFRLNIWEPALAAAGLDFHVRVHDLRHAHASWLLAGGADLQVVKERLGHASITTTEKYLHTLPTADLAALAALDTIRRRSTN